MPTTAIEQMGARSATNSGAEFTATRAFHVQGAEDEMGVFDAYGVDGLPGYNDEHPTLLGMFVQDTAVTQVPNHSDLWKVVVTYKPFVWQFSDFNPEQPLVPGTPGYIDFTANTHGSFEQAYRKDAMLSQVGWNEGDDIGGTPIAPGGEPTSIPRLKIDFVLTVTEQMGDIEWETIQTYVGTRNETGFQGLTKEHVVYLGCDAARVDTGTVRVSHKFQYDAFKHLVQVAGKSNSGDVKQAEGIGSSGSQPKSVFHVQPFEVLNDFNNLSKWLS